MKIAGSMEFVSIKKMLLRPKKRYSVKYINYIDDGDFKKFTAL